MIQNRTLKDKDFHNNLFRHIENLREKTLEEKFPGIKIGLIISPGIYINPGKIKKYVSEINEFDDFLEEELFPAIKFNIGEFTKN